MTRAGVNRLLAIAPVAFSALALAIVLANILAGVPRQVDETASAHLWQLLIGGQVPLIMLFAVTADWRSRSTPALLGAQFAAISIACAPVLIVGY